MRTKFSYKLHWFIDTYFKNLIIELHVFYVLNTHVKFFANWMLFIIWSINLFFIHNFIIQKTWNLNVWLISWLLIFYFFENFASMKDIRRKYNLMIDLSKFTPNNKILSGVVTLGYNQVCSQSLFKNLTSYYWCRVTFFRRSPKWMGL